MIAPEVRPQDVRARVLATSEVAADFYVTRLRAAKIAATVEPGQFVNLRVHDSMSPLLRIPLSVSAANADAGTIEVMYEDLGPKSRILSRCRPGDELACLGPLGNTFPAASRGRRVVLVAGGIGLPPILFYGNAVTGTTTVSLLVGARYAAKLPPADLFGESAARVSIATDDGSAGHRGMVTELLESELDLPGPAVVCSCGPHAMMAAVAAICRNRNIPCHVSLEEYMACGFGVCVGCVVERDPGADGLHAYSRFSRICVDGPVYEATRVKW